jgi:hypothetical protein
MNPDADFKIILLHDDQVACLHGAAVLERLAGQLEEECDKLNTETWKFEALRQPVARDQAAYRIREANMIIISANGGEELPEYIKHWIEDILYQRRDRETAIVALLSREPAPDCELPRLGNYLRALAEKSGLDFFCNQGAGPTRLEPLPEPVRPPVPSASAAGFAPWNDVVPRDSGLDGWGIND